jgi:hypothetical protein
MQGNPKGEFLASIAVSLDKKGFIVLSSDGRIDK